MEFDIEIAPYQKLHAASDTITVDTQPGSVPAANDPLSSSCERQLVRHRMYRLYLSKQDFSPATYFEAIASMMSPRDIALNGDEVLELSWLSLDPDGTTVESIASIADSLLARRSPAASGTSRRTRVIDARLPPMERDQRPDHRFACANE